MRALCVFLGTTGGTGRARGVSRSVRVLARSLLLTAACASWVGAAPEEPAGEPKVKASKTKQDKKKDWAWDVDLGVRGRYNSNVFRLSDRTLDRYDADRESDETSGRFDRMSATDDFVVTPQGEIRLSGSGLGGRNFKAWFGFEYDYAVRNSVMRHPRFELSASQKLGKGRKMGLELEYAKGRFRRNYLAGSTDLTGSVSSSERRFRRGTFDSAEFLASYEQRLWERKKGKKRKKSRLAKLGLRSVVAHGRLGYARRSYDHFSNRNRNELRFGTGLDSRIGKRWRVELDYELRSIYTANNREFLVLDESDFGIDLNGDFDAVDQNVPSAERVDRSRLDHTVTLEMGWKPAKRIGLKAGYAFTFQDYRSDERFDLTYNARSDERHRVFGELEWRFAKRWAAALSGDWSDEQSSRLDMGDEPEETSYSRYRVSFGISRRF